jgi:hypothetical protein
MPTGKIGCFFLSKTPSKKDIEYFIKKYLLSRNTEEFD